jgi:hypothetical protein
MSLHATTPLLKGDPVQIFGLGGLIAGFEGPGVVDGSGRVGKGVIGISGFCGSSGEGSSGPGCSGSVGPGGGLGVSGMDVPGNGDFGLPLSASKEHAAKGSFESS